MLREAIVDQITNKFFIDPLKPGDIPHLIIKDMLFQFCAAGEIDDYSLVVDSQDHIGVHEFEGYLYAMIRWNYGEQYMYYTVHFYCPVSVSKTWSTYPALVVSHEPQ